MPQIVKVEVRDASAFDSTFEGIPYAEWSGACGVRKNELGIEASHLDMLCENVQGVPSQRHRPCLTVLRLVEGQHITFQIDV